MKQEQVEKGGVVRLDGETHRRLRLMAAEAGVSAKYLAEACINAHFENTRTDNHGKAKQGPEGVRTNKHS